MAQRLRRAVSQIHKKCNFRPKSRHRRLLGGTADETHTAKRARKHPDACMEASIFEAFGSDAYAVEGGVETVRGGEIFPSEAISCLVSALEITENTVLVPYFKNQAYKVNFYSYF